MKFMKPFLISFLLLFSMISGSFAQVVVTVPVNPTDMDSVTVIFDATQGNAGLKNVPPPIYAHTGVITNLSVSPSDWKYVLAPWNVNIPKAMMTPLGNNLYQLKMTPSIREFYGVPQGEQILKMAFVFRNSDGSKTGREANGGDIFVDVYPTMTSINRILPQNTPLYLPLNEPIPISAKSPLADTMALYLNNSLVKKVAGQSLTDTLIANNFGSYWTKQWIRIKAWNDTASVADSFYYAVITSPAVASLPAGVQDGINYVDSTTVILSLLAPWKYFCFVTGDFNSWLQDSSFYMKRTPDSLRFWLQINNLTPHKEYIFQYFVDGSIRIADPYSDKISDPNDQYIDPATYPNLISYPTGKTTEIASVLETGRPSYPWINTSFSPPDPTNLVIYELLIRDFTTAHDYPSLEDTLGYLKRLGINAIELMPVMEFEGNSSWGYNPDFMFAPDKYYGTREGLKHFIDYAHSQGFAIILDIVMNHQFGSSPLVRLYWDDVNSRPAANNPWFNPIPKHPFNVGSDMNHESPYTRAYCERLLKYWIQEYHADGYRFDLSKGFTQTNSYPDNMTLWNQYDSGRISTLDDYQAAVKSVKTDGIVILEHFANNDEQTRLSSDGMLLWGNMNGPYSKGAEGYVSGGVSDISWISYKQLGWADPHLVGYMESHDEERMMYNTITYGNISNADYNVKDTLTALQRMALSAVFFYTIPGPKMNWQFGEMGYDYSINYPCGTSDCRLSPKPIRWDYYSQWGRRYLYNIYSSLIDLKKNQNAFRTPDFKTDLSGGMKSIHLNDPTMDVTVLGNFTVYGGQINPNFQKKGMWYDYFSGDSLSVTDTAALITLLPGEYHLYTSVKLKKPLFTGIDEPGSSTVSNGNVILYPNPSSGIVWIRSDAKIDRVEIYSLTGIRLNIFEHPGKIDISNLSPGLYLARIQFSGRPAEVVKISRE